VTQRRWRSGPEGLGGGQGDPEGHRPHGAAGETHALMGRTARQVHPRERDHGPPGYTRRAARSCSRRRRERAHAGRARRRGLFLAMQYPVEVPGVSVVNFLRTAYTSVKGGRSAPRLPQAHEGEDERPRVEDAMVNRYLNQGFSGGEKKRTRSSARGARAEDRDPRRDGLGPGHRLAEAGGDGGCTARGPELGVLLVTHYQRILNYITPDHVHVMMQGRIVRSGGKELAHELEQKGYEEIRRELASSRTPWESREGGGRAMSLTEERSFGALDVARIRVDFPCWSAPLATTPRLPGLSRHVAEAHQVIDAESDSTRTTTRTRTAGSTCWPRRPPRCTRTPREARAVHRRPDPRRSSSTAARPSPRTSGLRVGTARAEGGRRDPPHRHGAPLEHRPWQLAAGDTGRCSGTCPHRRRAPRLTDLGSSSRSGPGSSRSPGCRTRSARCRR